MPEARWLAMMPANATEDSFSTPPAKRARTSDAGDMVIEVPDDGAIMVHDSADKAYDLGHEVEVEKGEDFLLNGGGGSGSLPGSKLSLSKIPPGTPAGEASYLLEFMKVATSAVHEVCKTYGGPQQYLQHRYATKETRQNFAENLFNAFPVKDLGLPNRFRFYSV